MCKGWQFCLTLCLFVILSGCSDKPELKPLADDAVILAFGDSLTHGTGGKGSSYPSELASLTGRTVINAGIPGEVSGNGLKRLPGLLDRHTPAMLILCHGGNDILRRLDRDAMRNNLAQMIELAHSRSIDVVFIGVPEFSLFLSATEQHDSLAEQYQLAYLPETLPNILKKGSLKADQIHPNADGYRLMANDVYQLLVESGAL